MHLINEIYNTNVYDISEFFPTRQLVWNLLVHKSEYKLYGRILSDIQERKSLDFLPLRKQIYEGKRLFAYSILRDTHTKTLSFLSSTSRKHTYSDDDL